MASSPAAATIDSLPLELLYHVFSFLSTEPPSQQRMRNEPRLNMLRRRPETPLKTVSVVTHHWRSVVLPLLFRHVLWDLDRWALLRAEPVPDDDIAAAEAFPILSFLRAGGLACVVETLTMTVYNSLKGNETPSRVASFLGLDEPRLPHGSKARWDSGNIMALGGRPSMFFADNNWFWRLLFRIVEPCRLTIISSPEMMASILSRAMFLGDDWNTRKPYQILSLARENRWRNVNRPPVTDMAGAGATSAELSAPSSSSAPPTTDKGMFSCQCSRSSRSKACELFTIRPWTSLLLNEGTAQSLSRTHETFYQQTQTLLGTLLGCEAVPNSEPLVPPSVRDFAYVAVFPPAGHFKMLVRHLPRLDRLFVQLAPSRRPSAAPATSTPAAPARSLAGTHELLPLDLWTERNTCYGLIIRELMRDGNGVAENFPEMFVGDVMEDEFDITLGETDGDGFRPRVQRSNNWRHLRIFETGDARDQDAWDIAVQYMQLSRSGWRVEGHGIFVRE